LLIVSAAFCAGMKRAMIPNRDDLQGYLADINRRLAEALDTFTVDELRHLVKEIEGRVAKKEKE
jgi:hypothetical protein